MKGILIAKLRLLIRSPFPIIILTFCSIFFAYLVGNGYQAKLSIPVYSHDPKMEESAVWKALTRSDVMEFERMGEEEVKKLVSEGKAEAGIELKEDHFRVMIASHTGNVSIIQQYVQRVYSNVLLEEHIMEAASKKKDVDVKKLEEELKNDSLFTIQTESFRGKDSFVHDSQLQSIFGFSLFLVIYTIAYNVLPILQEKNSGIWDRMILSPVRKWEMYTANLFNSFILGYLQVAAIFLVFRYAVGVNFYGGFGKTMLILVPYVFCIVALSMLITGIVKNVQQFNAVISFVAVSLSMLGGAYWPIEIVTAKPLLAIAKADPIFYGMEALKGATVYGHTIQELLFPISILTLMGVLMIGIGINLMERRHV
ncbi:ABC-2 type transport system permease protein [Oikeobacillus pervagus]|uniref:ABC-2 type transport system permease protein n=1 Tax=Oikeobacillus pervagus TaxID=1325931 RepID=A0AAJ1T7P6_9BACI|nr:ABC transporter permease [Oikeobacillus pervagus]MDQ0216095.1 ABC-2 type transport system permease protein [Oikeobacillus pervagus]